MMLTLASLALAAGLASADLTSPPRIAVGPNIRVSQRDGIPHVETCVAAHPTDPNIVIVSCNCFHREIVPAPNLPNYRAASLVFVTHDGGKTWTEKVMPNDNSDVNAQVAFGPEGAAYFTTLDRNDPSRKLARSKIPIWKSLDGGRTWDGPVLFGRLADHPSLAVDTTTSRFRGRVYLSTNEGNRFSVYRSADGGQTFSEPVSHKHSNTVVTDKIVVLPDGAVLILFKEYTDSANVWEVALCTILSEDGGETFTNRRLVARKISTLHIPPSEGMVTQRGGSGNGDSSAAIDTKGRVHVVWTD